MQRKRQHESNLTSSKRIKTTAEKPESSRQSYSDAFFDFATKYLFGPDVFQLKKEKSTFIMDTLYKRAMEENDNFASIKVLPLWASKMLGLPHQIYVVSGPENLRMVGDFGEEKPSPTHPQLKIEGDPKARSGFDILKNVLSSNTLFLQQGKSVKHKKMILKEHLHKTENIVEISRDYFARGIKSWDPNDSYQNQITSIVCNVIAKSVFGINNLPKKYIPRLRQLPEALLAVNQDNQHIATCMKSVLDMNRELLEESEEMEDILAKEDILNSAIQQLEGTKPKTYLLDALDEYIQESAQNFSNHYLELKRAELLQNPELLKRTLIESRVFSLFIMESSLSQTVMRAIAYLNKNPAVKKRLTLEVKECRMKNGDPIPYTAFKELAYLKCVLLELLRLTSPVPGVSRRTSVSSNLVVLDKDGNKRTHLLAPNSMLFAPLRSSHFDERLWSRRDIYLRTTKPTDNDINNNNLYLYLEIDENKNETIWYATKIGEDIVRAEIKENEYREHFFHLLAAFKKPTSENEQINKRAKNALLDLTFNRKHTISNPLEFDPSRFEGDGEEVVARHKLLRPFASGLRQCAAQEFVVNVVDAIIIDSLYYDFQFDKEIPQVRPFTSEVSWSEELYATVSSATIEEIPQNTSGFRV